MSVEAVRGCGFRKVGGLYLCGEGLSMVCDRLPYELIACPTCGSGIKFTRGFTWIDWFEYAGLHIMQPGNWPCKCPSVCPVCSPPELIVDVEDRLYGLLWVGEAFYTPEAFIQECIQMGASRRIAAVPRNLKLGKTWILFAHKKAITKFDAHEKDPALGTTEDVPAIFYAFRPQRLELLIWESEATPDKLAELEKKGITPILIPDGDVDHDPRTGLKPKEEEKNAVFFGNLRERLEAV